MRSESGLRWTYPNGIAEIGRRLRDAMPGLDLRLQTRVERIAPTGTQWTAVHDDGLAIGEGFDAVLLTAPAPQAADLLRSADVPPALVDALEATPYRSQFTVVWGFEERVERPGAFYALVNSTEHGEETGGWPSRATSPTGRPRGARCCSPR